MNRFLKNKKKIIAATIGLGFGTHHVNVFKNNKSVKMKYICDYKSKYKKYSKITGAKFITDYKKVFNDKEINLVSIASYDNFHFQQVKLGIESKKNIFVEKPICQNFKQFIKIKKKLNNYKRKISSNFVLRYHPKFMEVQKLIRKKKIGKIYSIEGEYNYGRIKKLTHGWRGKIPFYSVVQGGGIHIIDLMIWLNKSNPKKVISIANKLMTKNSQFKYFDNNIALIHFDNGVTGKVSSNFSCMAPHHHYLKIFGSKGTIEVNFDSIVIYNSRDHKVKPKIIKFTKINKNYKNGVLEKFIKSVIKNKSVNNPTLKEILISISTCLSIDKSFKTKKWEKVIY